jgi:methyl-accepting chemotaxis protein
MFDAATLLRLVPISIVLLTGLALSLWTHRLLNTHQGLVVHTYAVITTTKDILIGLDDAETGERGYLLSFQASDLAPYTRARDRLDRIVGEFRTLVADNPDQIAHLDRLQGLMAQKLALLEKAIDARRTQGFDAALAILLASHDQEAMDAIRAEIGQMTHVEQALLTTRGAEVEADEQRVAVVAAIIGVLSLLTRAAVELYLARRARLSDAAAGYSDGRAGQG